ncbi:hypothetical protein ACK3SF_00580 [Candidatus Nanosalina sp. VS9-1]|uniref:hypothetical protein n=1 Tax=Candidatus Nanosalina sp. VS9-1 TaxID=3388566 RepID=UPI0039E09BCA
MDKTLEIVLVATTLVVASVVVVSMLQGQSSSFGDFSEGQTSSASCGLGYQQWQQSIDCGGGSADTTSRSDELESEYDDCEWTDSPSASEAC